MSERRQRRHRRRGADGGNAFMDTVRQAYVRWAALEKWRQVEDLRETLGYDLTAAVQDASTFPNRGRYEAVWRRHWQEQVTAAPPDDSSSVFAAIERAVAGAVAEEEASRQAQGDAALEEDPEYKGFVDRAMARLLSETAAQLEYPYQPGSEQ